MSSPAQPQPQGHTATPHPHFLSIQAPAPLPPAHQNPTVFLAGSIDQGLTEDWQTQATHALAHLPLTVLNPRRRDWDSSWDTTDPHFAPLREQISWELDMQEGADVVAMLLRPASPAPISLLELGLAARSGRLVVACSPGFYHAANVHIVCERYGVEVVDGLQELVAAVVRRVGARARGEGEDRG